MAKEILVREILSNEMIKAGLTLIERLDTENAQLTSAFWLYNEEDRGWKLILDSPLVTDLGPREYYRKVINANNFASEDEEILSTHDISVTNTADKIVQLLKCTILTLIHYYYRIIEAHTSNSSCGGKINKPLFFQTSICIFLSK